MIDLDETFVISDHRFRDWKHIPFYESTDEEDELHVALLNSIVGMNDLVLYVGEFCDGGIGDVCDLSRRLNGRKILIKGIGSMRNGIAMCLRLL